MNIKEEAIMYAEQKIQDALEKNLYDLIVSHRMTEGILEKLPEWPSEKIADVMAEGCRLSPEINCVFRDLESRGIHSSEDISITAFRNALLRRLQEIRGETVGLESQ